MLPFVTKVNTNVHSPFRMLFKLGGTPGSTIVYDGNTKLVLKWFDLVGSFTTYECLLK